MSKLNTQKEKLDRIGRNLLEAARMPNDEIEKIVAAPRLFDSVKARISAEQNRRTPKSAFGNRHQLIFWNWQRISVVSTALFFFVLSVFGVVLFSKLDKPVERVSVPKIETKSELFETPPAPDISDDFPAVPQTKIHSPKPEAIAKQNIGKIEKPEKRKSSQRINFVKKSNLPKNEPGGEFFALTFTGNPGENREVMQIIRTELSPSSLFALGVNLPIENAPEKIKADLLVGSDGVARAIRFVE